MEEKKPRFPIKAKTEKAESEEKKITSRKSTGAADDAGKIHTDSTVVPTEPVTIPSEWTSHGAIALVSHGTISGITVIHTEVSPGTQIQPIVTTDSTGASVISAVPFPFSLPVSMAHTVPLSSEVASTSLSVPTLSVPVSDGFLTSVTEIPTVSTSSVLEAAASQTILAPVSDSKASSETEALPPDIQTVVVGEKHRGKRANRYSPK